MDAPTNYTETFVELIRRASTELPAEVVAAIEEGRDAEDSQGLASIALGTILNNIDLARESSAPICQDTGTPVVWIHHPVGMSTRKLKAEFETAVREATARRFLRPNAVDTLTGLNTGDGAGRGIPFIHFEEWDEPGIEARMILKGGGSENVGSQYKLPDTGLGAGRDLDGVRRAVLDAVFQAQGKGCGPGILGVCVGGDRGSGYIAAKETLFRMLDEKNENPTLGKLENRIMKEGNGLNIGPMGFGGATTLLGVKITHRNRVPASFFVSVAYMCWAFRRNGFMMSGSGRISRWLYES